MRPIGSTAGCEKLDLWHLLFLPARDLVPSLRREKAYALLEAEGLLVRNRGKPMTVAASRRSQQPISQRLRQVESHLMQLISAARQLDIPREDLVELLEKRWRQKD
jgi:GntR family transcriptional regulator